MKNIELEIAEMQPRTVMLAREMLGVVATILAHAKEDPKAVLAEGADTEIVLNVKNALEFCPGAMEIGRIKKKRRGAALPRSG